MRTTVVLRALAMLALALTLPTGSVLAQPATVQPASSEKPRTSSSVTALRVQLTLTRYEGEKRVATVPLMFTVLPGGGASRLNMGSETPVPSGVPGESVGVVGPQGFNYRSTGTAVTATASETNGVYGLALLVDSTWVNETSGKPGPPQFGSFRAEQNLTLTDGQTVQFTSAADPASQQTVKVEISVSRQR